MTETSKAHGRRERDGFFAYLKGQGIDIGCGNDKVTPDADGWDLYQAGHEGDATFMEGVTDEKYDWVYSSHCLEHVSDQRQALKSWWRILRHGGHLLLYVPHRDLYEKKERPPSHWNPEHTVFFVPDKHLHADVLGLKQLVEETLPDSLIIYVRTCDEGHTVTRPDVHSDGEISIEMVVRKP